MKKIIYIICIITIITSCEKPWNCENKNTPKIETEFILPAFDKISIFNNVELILEQGVEQKIRLQTTKKSIKTVTIKSEDSTLIIKQKDNCPSAKIKAYITSPNITELRNASLLPISSKGVLNYPTLTLYSEDFLMPKVLNVGDFHLKVNCEKMTVVSNQVSSFYISGKTKHISFYFYGLSRFEGENLIADDIFLNHAGHNNIIISPKTRIFGNLYGTGNVVCMKKPKITDVKCHYTGKIIYK